MENLDTHAIAYEGQNLYDFDNEILLNWYPQRILNLCEGANSILELGLGHGYTTDIFSRQFKRHLVLDGSSAVIKNFKKNFPDCKAEIIETYFEHFESDELFDIIVLGFILEHVDNPFEILTQFRKFLAPNGKMYVAVPNAEVLNRRLGYLSGLLSDMETLSENDILLGHKRYFSVKSLVEEVKKAQYDILKIEGIYLKPFTTKQILSLNLGKEIIESLCKVGIDYPELSCGILMELK